MISRWLLVPYAAIVAALWVGTGSITRAQLPADRATDSGRLARAQLEVADRAFHEKRFRDAAAAYLEADRLEPSAAVQLALGKTFEELNEPSRALAAYREYITRAPRAPDRATAQARVAALSQQLAERGVQQVSVTSVPAGASVIVDGKTIGATPLYVDLPPGRHHLEFHQQGYDRAALDFDLTTQQPLNVMTTLVPTRDGPRPSAAAAPAPPAGETPAPPAEEIAVAAGERAADQAQSHTSVRSGDTVLRTIGFAAIGTSIAALGGAVTLELMRSHSESKARQQEQQIAFARTLDTMQSQQTAARVFAVAAGVLAAAGGALLVLAIEDGSADASESAAVAWGCSLGACHATLEGHF